MDSAADNTTDDQRGVLRRHHRQLDQLLDTLQRAFMGGDREQMQQLWSRFESELLEHFEFEEKEVFPTLAGVAPAEASALCSEHASMRAKVAELGVAVDLHMLRADVVTALVAELEHHADREDSLLYRWIDAGTDRGLAASIRSFAAALLHEGQARRTVVYIEDDPSGIAFMQDVLADFDRVELLTAPTAEIGVEIARVRRPDVIIIDIPPSRPESLAATKRLREWPETRDIPVIGLSSPAGVADSAGPTPVVFSRYLQKPVKVDELVRTLETYFKPRPQPPYH